jgi:hypothetical protein
LLASLDQIERDRAGLQLATPELLASIWSNLSILMAGRLGDTARASSGPELLSLAHQATHHRFTPEMLAQLEQAISCLDVARFSSAPDARAAAILGALAPLRSIVQYFTDERANADRGGRAA